MYLFNLADFNLNINKKKASEVIGISRQYLTNIVNGKISCTKVVAFCITKYLDKNAEIEDFFIKKGE